METENSFICLKVGRALVVLTPEEWRRAIRRGKSVRRNRRYAQERQREKEERPLWVILTS